MSLTATSQPVASSTQGTVVAGEGIGDVVERPALVWWVLVIGGLGILALQSWNNDFYAWWTSHVNALPGQAVMGWIFLACIPIHVGEALYVYATAPRRGLTRTRTAWALQTLVLGYPSTHLFRKRNAPLGG